MTKTKSIKELLETALEDMICNISAVDDDSVMLLSLEIDNPKNSENLRTILMTCVMGQMIAAGMPIKHALSHAIEVCNVLEETQAEYIKTAGLNRPPRELHS
jgi:hypothetical protein